MIHSSLDSICIMIHKFNFFLKFFQATFWVSWFGSRSGRTFCLSWSGSKPFAKVISRQQKSLLQGSHKLWKSWKTWKITKKSSMHGKIMEFEKTWINIEKSWNFLKYEKPTISKRTSCQTLACSTASFLANGGFKFSFFQNACMVYKHAVVAAFSIYAQHGEVAAKVCALISHGNYIVDHGKSWKNQGIVFLNFCGQRKS